VGPVRRARRPRLRDTRDRLLDAAERLFAERGIQGVSLREVVRAAGARNATAVHFHFRSKDGLLRAVVARRMDALSAERIDGLRRVAAAAGDAPPDLRAVVDAALRPTVRRLADPHGPAGRGWTSYLVLLARVGIEPGIRPHELATPAFFESSTLLVELVKRALPDVPTNLLVHRLFFAIDFLAHTVAHMARLAAESAAAADPTILERFTEELIDFTVGGLAAAPRATDVRTSPARTRSARRAAPAVLLGLAGLRTGGRS